RTDAATDLLDRGAPINLIPAGFDYAGTALHYAAIRGRREMVDVLLERGADPNVRDAKIGKWPEDWAAFDGHSDLAGYLQQDRQARD
ncbi:ankyrin repeat domain-containing protein, partial [Singulisphaera rosea]